MQLDWETIAQKEQAQADVAAASPSTMDRLQKLASEFETLRIELDGVNELKKRLQARFDELKNVLIPEEMEAAGLVKDNKGSFTTATGARIHLRTGVFANCKAAARESFHQWLRDNNMGDLIRESVHAQTLKSFAKERLESGEPLPDGVTAYIETAAVLTLPKGA